MVDACFGDPRLAVLYDPLESDRSDLDAYVAMAEEFRARTVLDIGCGTGVFALRLAELGLRPVGLDPAGASLDVARSKPGSDRVRWIHGDADRLPPLQVDLVTMTGNVAQAVVDPAGWARTLRAAYDSLRPGGRLVFETRNPARCAWRTWNRESSYRVTDVPGTGRIESWVDLTAVDLPLVSFRWTYVLTAQRRTLTSDSTLRFRELHQLEAELAGQGFTVEDVRDASDRPGLEFVLVARRA